MPLRIARAGGVLSLLVALCVTAGCTDIFSTIAGAVIDDQLGQIDRLGVNPGKPAYKPQSFVNWETPHVSPLALSPDGSRLLSVNTPAARLELFDLSSGQPVHAGRIPVGLEPVTVRLRDNAEAWVINALSDSVSIVDLVGGAVVRTLTPGDEPADVAFAGGRAYVSCNRPNRLVVYDLNDLDASPGSIELAGTTPRSIAVSADHATLAVGIFGSGNGTTLVSRTSALDPNGPYGGVNPPPTGDPAVDAVLAGSPPSSVIVKKDPSSGQWRDERGANWSPFVKWDLHDHDLALIDVASHQVRYVSGLMNLVQDVSIRPDGTIVLVGTQAHNEVRFEPRNTGRFVRSTIALVDPAAGASTTRDLNPHLAAAYQSGVSTIPAAERSASLADPRQCAWSADGKTGYVVGLGSNNVAVIDTDGGRIAHIPVGQGPTGVQFDAGRGRIYVLNRFDATISTLDAGTTIELSRVSFPDPTPQVIRYGRPFLYDAHLTSGLGVTACAACHVNGRTDGLAWDLGDPAGRMKGFDQACDRLIESELAVNTVLKDTTCEDFHPVKGPFLTQTLQGIIGTEPFHWRGDRRSLREFNGAFVSLNGRESELSTEELDKLEAFVATIQFPPNPFRNIDNSLPERGPLGGDPRAGQDLYFNVPIDGRASLLVDDSDILGDALAAAGPIVTCNRCHQAPIGTNHAVVPGRLLGTAQSMKVPQLRGMYEKLGFSKSSAASDRGFGFTHDGGLESLDEFFHLQVFDFGEGALGDQRRTDVIAFVFLMGDDTHAGAGRQVTLRGQDSGERRALLEQMLAIAAGGDVGLAVHVRESAGGDAPAGGYVYSGGGLLRGLRDGRIISAAELQAFAAPGAEQTWTLTPLGTEESLAAD